MFSFLSRVRYLGTRETPIDDDNSLDLPLPATNNHSDRQLRSRGRADSPSSIGAVREGRLQRNTLSISAPIPRSSPSSITGFDNDNIPSGGGASTQYASSTTSSTSGYGNPVVQQYHQVSLLPSSQQLGQSSYHISYSYPWNAHQLVIAQPHGYGHGRAGPSNVAWVGDQHPGAGADAETGGDVEVEEEIDDASPEEQERMARYASSSFPAVIRLDSGESSYPPGNFEQAIYAPQGMGRSIPSPLSQSYVPQQPQYIVAVPYIGGSPAAYSFIPDMFNQHGSLQSRPGGSGRTNIRLNLNTNVEFVQNVQALQLMDRTSAAAATDVFAGAYDYPRAKQLSPIAEVDYVSPDSLKKTKSLPFMGTNGGNTPTDASTPYSRQNTNNTINTSANNPSPGGSQGSEITRKHSLQFIFNFTAITWYTGPSPVYASPFITRSLNRTVSQTSSRTHASTASSVVPRSTTTKSNDPPSLPPLDLRPPFPGPHPGHGGTSLRPPKLPHRDQQGGIVPLPTIVGSVEDVERPGEERYTTDDVASLHADSFVTATSYGRNNSAGGPPTDRGDTGNDTEGEGDEREATEMTSTVHLPHIDIEGESRAELMSLRSGQSQIQSASESFITRRWEYDAGYGIGGRVTVLKSKRQNWVTATPAFWAFWLGFLCPVLWLIGGWHFTHFGEQPPRLTFWEFYFNAGYWKEKLGCCYGRRRRSLQAVLISTEDQEAQELGSIAGDATGRRKGKEKQQDPPPLPRWVAEKQPSDQRRARLNDPKRSLRGISFGYPFIPRPIAAPRREGWSGKAMRRFLSIVTAPNRLFDHLYGVKLLEVRGRAESRRRMFDPWIQRCRYAFCYSVIVLSIGLCVASTYLIIYNTRQLR
ncbi:hypothetical protein AMATHDRAFT_38671 [Amanita thiersii Skay4041]|uniref:Uncharacterized protein n=1 Tax=Amanita thiersii Skay4041 TaxID=703135 RepID=A0A2A9NZE8_9AGAR|nr:hypothetical protein AMATHDRAFT_38671 [Amanita thiersii Skay4041]